MGRLVTLGLFEREEDQTFVPTKQLREVEVDRALRLLRQGTGCDYRRLFQRALAGQSRAEPRSSQRVGSKRQKGELEVHLRLCCVQLITSRKRSNFNRS
jgi:hypothetical protein